MGWISKKTMEGLDYYYNEESQEITWEKPKALQSREEKEMSQGDWTWVPHPVHLWQPAQRVQTNGDGSVDTRTEKGQMVTIPADGIVEGPLTGGKKVHVPLWPLQRTSLMFQEDDLVMLDQLNEAMIMTNLRTRYEKNMLYTFVGASRTVLVSVNPYKKLALYSTEQIELYRFKPPNTKLDPHVFDIANDAYNSLLFGNANQSILISGESGAGKTVATKHCLSFLAHVAGSERNVEERVVMANPILEAYGNAQTIRNNNSSRFGKWIQVYFDPMQRCIVSAEIINYLLEKSRLVGQQKGERNYHIFYQLTKDSGAKSKYGLEGPKSYRYTNVSGTFDAHLIDDIEEFDQVKKAMAELGFSEGEKDFLFSVAAAVLELGNCDFDPKAEKNNVKGSKLKSSSQKNAARVAQLLGMKEAELVKVLSNRSITVRGITNVIPLDPEKARASADSLAMGIYGKMFNWLVQRINQSLVGDKGSGGNTFFIGILDIFGFEIFDQNSFEQLCINFANEKLQQQFNKTTFKDEEALYVKEGIKFTHVEFIDNQVVCDLIEKGPKGLLPMLDDECLIPEGSDVKYMNKIEDSFKAHDKFQTDVHRKLDNSFNFEIVHYAGVVKYNGEGFMVKNTDSMFPDQERLCNTSSNEFIQKLFTTEGAAAIKKARSMNKVVKAGSKGPKSLSYQFRGQLKDLMDQLESTESRYIRCVKPNNDQKPDQFISVLVNEQLVYSGVYEAVEIRKQGFPFRLSHSQFACRYGCINMDKDQYGRDVVASYRNNVRDNPRGVCEELLEKNRYNFGDVIFGKTRCLYKTQEHRLLTLLRELALEKLIPRAQSSMKGHLAREMRRKCEKLNVILQQAMDVGNDIDLIDEALAKIDPELGPFLHLFPGVYPTKKKAAIERREALEKWKELEAEFERVNTISDGGQDEFDTIDRLVAAGRAILSTPRTKRQIELFEDAVEQRNHLEVKLQQQEIENNLEKYSTIATFSRMRNPRDYTKTVMYMRGAYEKVHYIWQKSRLPNSLTELGDDKETVKVAKSALDKIKEFTGQKKNKKQEPPEIAAEFFQIGKTDANFSDECWVQLLKMATQNPHPEQLLRVWDLIAMAIFVLQPSPELEYYIVCKFREAPENTSVQYTSAFHAMKYSGNYRDAPDMTMPEQVRGHGRNAFSVRYD